MSHTHTLTNAPHSPVQQRKKAKHTNFHPIRLPFSGNLERFTIESAIRNWLRQCANKAVHDALQRNARRAQTGACKEGAEGNPDSTEEEDEEDFDQDGWHSSCCLCQHEGELRCCDDCPRVFHTSCARTRFPLIYPEHHVLEEETDVQCPWCHM